MITNLLPLNLKHQTVKMLKFVCAVIKKTFKLKSGSGGNEVLLLKMFVLVLIGLREARGISEFAGLVTGGAIYF